MKLTDWIGFLALVISLWILWEFRQILLLFFTATVLAIALNSLVRLLMRRFDLKRLWAVVLALWAVVIGLVIFFSVVVPPFVDQFQELIQLVPAGLERLLARADEVIENPPAWLPQPGLEDLPSLSEVAQQLGAIAQNVFGNFFAFFSGSVAVLLQIVLIAVLTLMLLAEPLSYRRLFLRLFPSFYRRRADEIFSLCESSLLNWLAGFSLSSIFVALCSGLGLLVLGIPLVFAHALLAGVANLIPNLGPTLSVVFPLAVALLNSPGKAIAVILLYVAIQNVESYWFSPLIMRQQVSLLPAATLIAQLFFASFLGPLGLLLAVPLAVVLKIWVEEAFIKDVLDAWNGRSPRQALALELATPAGPLPDEAVMGLNSDLSNREPGSGVEINPAPILHPDPQSVDPDGPPKAD